MTVIGWHTWEPGLQGNTLTSAGGGAWTEHLFQKLTAEGDEIVWLGGDPLPRNTKHGDVKDLDIMVLCWRWAMPSYPERNELYLGQMRLIQLAERFDVPILVHDQDHMISYEDRRTLQWNHAVIATPELKPAYPDVESLIFPNPYEFSMPQVGAFGKWDMVYIGNNYGRYAQFKEYLQPWQKQKTLQVYGNWLEPNPDRERPELVLAQFPNTIFPGRLPQEKVIETMRNANSTIHLFKQSYGETGFITIRWAEAAAAGIPAFVPNEFYLPRTIRHRFLDANLIAYGGLSMVSSYELLMADPDLWRKAAETQKEFVNAYMKWSNWADLIHKIAKRKIKS